MTIRERRDAAVKAGTAIIEKARSEKRDLTTSERETLATKSREVEELTSLLAKADADAEMFAQIAGGDGEGDASHRKNDGSTAITFKGAAKRLITDGDGGRLGIKSLLAVGSQTTETQEIGLRVIKERPPTSLLESIPGKVVDENFSYLRQTTRTNNAAPVAVGATKPTSVFTLTRVESRLRVVAHISEPIPEYWLKDDTSLEQFVSTEMVNGLADAVMQQFISGDGVGENLSGFTLASGIQTQAFVTDAIGTARRALNQLETIGIPAAFYVIHPTDWLAMELTRENGATGGYLLGSDSDAVPVDRVKRQLWGVPVVLSMGITAGNGYVVGEDSLMAFTDGVLSIKWAGINDDFAKNQIRCRAESRFQMGTVRPAGVVKFLYA